jgi:oxygen-independent coproporphyrinogen-3 oxidase
MFRFEALPPLSLYVHFPWCVRKCPYCDFNSHPLKDRLPEARYIEALLADLEHDLPRVWGRRVQTVFLGGGTPSLVSPEAIERLLAGIRARLPLAPDAEVTLEANPGTSDAERFAGYRAAGVNRLSIGIQSFDDRQLKALGRIHGRDEALAAAMAARAAGFDNFNLDLMFGLPDQTPDAACADLRTALALQPAHLSLYQLTLEPDTPFHAAPPALPDDETIAAIQEQLQAELAAHDFRQYEVSAWARAGRECRHNRNYWEFGDYLGIGAGAHAKLTGAEGITRRARRKQPNDYLVHAGTAAALASETHLTAHDAAFEFMLNALRLVDGVPATLFSERSGLVQTQLEPALAVARARGLLDDHPDALRPTPLGRRFLNDLIALFLPDAGRH